jgi:hypothetical protein
MVDQDELTWMRMRDNESQQAALIQQMQNSQQLHEYKTKCFNFVEALKKLRRECPNHMEFGEKYDELYKKYYEDTI